ncbi:MAG: hypothetical protein IJ849_07680 [Selenomonadaceae bacterium]|nr:hypothetical protein [Selenomonadaceae bacterium]
MLAIAVISVIGLVAYWLLDSVASNMASLGGLLILGFIAYAVVNGLIMNRQAYQQQNHRLLEDWFLYTLACSFGLFLGKYWQM